MTRAHVIAWRKDLEARGLAPASIRRKLSALSALFDYLCERNAVAGNPVDGVKRPMANGNEGSTPALGDAQARKLLDAPPEGTLNVVTRFRILASDDPTCETLLHLMDLFDSRTFESNGGLERLLSDGCFELDYDRHRQEARHAIEEDYKELICEVQVVIDRLSARVTLDSYSPPATFLANAP